MWAYKYAPNKLSEFAGNAPAVTDVQSWVRTWKAQGKKALLLTGPTGTGKTTVVNLIAKELGLNVVETSASDTRTAKALSEAFGTSLGQQSLFFKGKLVVFDEVDAISGRNDRGAAGEIVKIVASSKHPVILIANDASEKKISPIKKIAKVVKFSKIPADAISKALEGILNKEGVKYDDRALKAIARQADGDIRAAINDAEALSAGLSEVTFDAIKESGYRDFRKPIQEMLTIIFKTSSAKNASEAINLADEPLDNIIQWVRENIPREYKKSSDRARAYDMLSRADIFNGRIQSKQYWRYLVYVSSLLSSGVATAKDEKYEGVIDYHYPTKISLLGSSVFTRAKENTLAGKLAPYLHCSKKDARQYFRLLDLIQQNQPEAWDSIAERLDI